MMAFLKRSKEHEKNTIFSRQVSQKYLQAWNPQRKNITLHFLVLVASFSYYRSNPGGDTVHLYCSLKSHSAKQWNSLRERTDSEQGC